jgi:hypothetical protein
VPVISIGKGHTSRDRDGRHRAGHDVGECHPRRPQAAKGIH